jgi:hypothetical protein
VYIVVVQVIAHRFIPYEPGNRADRQCVYVRRDDADAMADRLRRERKKGKFGKQEPIYESVEVYCQE